MNRFSHYIRNIIDWYVWKIKMMKINKECDHIDNNIWFNFFGCDRYNHRDLASYRHYDSDMVNRDWFIVPIKHDVRRSKLLVPIRLNICRLVDGKSCDVVLPIRYRYSSGYEHPNAYKWIERILDYRC